MPKYVIRTDLQNRPVGKPKLCVDPMEMFACPGLPTVEQCVQLLLGDDEIYLGMSDKRRIMRGPRVVGYICIVEECAGSADAPLPGSVDPA